MRQRYPEVRLSDCTEKIGSGATPRGGQKAYQSSGMALVRSQNVYNNAFSYDGLAFISDQQAQELSNVTVKPGDILLNITGHSVARICQIPDDVLPARVNQHVAIIRPDHNVLNAKYLRYYLVSPYMQAYMLSLASSGGTRNALTKGMIENFRVPSPPLEEQHVIAHVLGTLDDKIELNHQMNQTLEAIARAIFKSWFVDFDPVWAKMDSQQPYGMDAKTAALFPAAFTDSPLGPIPEGWRVDDLPKAIEVNPRRPLSKGKVAPYLPMADMPTSSALPQNWKTREFNSGMRFMNGDVLVARITPCLENGKTAFVNFLDDGEIGWGSTEYIVFRSKAPLPLEYAYFLARTPEFRSHAIVNMTGTSGRQRVPKDCFNHYPVVVPSEPVAVRFGEIAGSIMAKMKQNDDQSRTLAELRDTLLPKLISGQLRVPDTETILSEVVR